MLTRDERKEAEADAYSGASVADVEAALESADAGAVVVAAEPLELDADAIPALDSEANQEVRPKDKKQNSPKGCCDMRQIAKKQIYPISELLGQRQRQRQTERKWW